MLHNGKDDDEACWKAIETVTQNRYLTMDKKTFSADRILYAMMEAAADNGYSIVVTKTEKGQLHVIAYPYRETACQEETLADLLFDVLDNSGIMTNATDYSRFRHEVEPDRYSRFIFPGDGNTETHVSVFHNNKIIVKQIAIRLC